MQTSTRLTVAVTLAPIVAMTWLLAAAPDEPAPTLGASALLSAVQLAGPHHRVAEAVETPGYFHQFTITSDYGTFQAIGRSMLDVRLAEVAALASLDDVSKSKVFLASAGTSVVNVGKGVANAATDPEATAKGIGGGVKRVGVNLGRRTKRTVDEATDDDKAEQGDKTAQNSAAESAANAVLGVNRAMRRWAQKVGVDPYTTNPVLRQALEDIAKYDAAGSIATKVVVPIPGVVGMTGTVGNLVWSKDPEELRKLNEQRLRDLGVDDATAKKFLLSSAITLTSQTRLIAALHAVRVGGCGDYVASAAATRSEREAWFFVESAELLQRLHAMTPVTSVLTDSRTLVAKTSGGAVALLPLDWVRSTGEAASTLRELADRARKELGAKALRLRVTGRITDRAARDFATIGWTPLKP